MTVDRYALCVGINDYAGTQNDLHGCVNDAEDWAAFLEGRGYKSTLLLDQQVTRDAFLGELERLVVSLGYRDRLVLTYSGHGSWLPDDNGDEVDGRDEVIVMSDLNFIRDDALRGIFAKRAYGTRLTFLSDSCFSGTITRFADFEHKDASTRFISPELLNHDYDFEDLRSFVHTPRTGLIGEHASILISGCDENEYSYDASYDGRPNGAFTRVAIDTFVEGNTYKQWHDAIRRVLPSDEYPQSPQLVATAYQRAKIAID
jgi:hypothetical protein